MSARRLIRRAVPAALGLAIVAALAPAPAFAASASTGVPTYKWTGADGTTGNDNWSDGKNWSGGVAPAAPGPVNLSFPMKACSGSCFGGFSNNDLTGLTVNKLTFSAPAPSYTTTQGPNINITGNAITLSGGLAATFLSSAGGGTNAYAGLGLPMTLSGAQTWSVSGRQGVLAVNGNVSGTMPLTIKEASGGNINIDGDVEVGQVSASSSGDSALFVVNGGRLNATDGNLVKIANIYFSAIGTTVGPLRTASAADLEAAASGVTHVNGTLTLDPTSLLQLDNVGSSSTAPVPGTDYPQIAATGAINLAKAALNLSTYVCSQPVGNVYTLLTGSSLTGQLVEGFALPNPGQVITSGTVLAMCGGSLHLRIDYSATSMTATVV